MPERHHYPPLAAQVAALDPEPAWDDEGFPLNRQGGRLNLSHSGMEDVARCETYGWFSKVCGLRTSAGMPADYGTDVHDICDRVHRGENEDEVVAEYLRDRPDYGEQMVTTYGHVKTALPWVVLEGRDPWPAPAAIKSETAFLVPVQRELGVIMVKGFVDFHDGVALVGDYKISSGPTKYGRTSSDGARPLSRFNQPLMYAKALSITLGEELPKAVNLVHVYGYRPAKGNGFKHGAFMVEDWASREHIEQHWENHVLPAADNLLRLHRVRDPSELDADTKQCFKYRKRCPYAKFCPAQGGRLTFNQERVPAMPNETSSAMDALKRKTKKRRHLTQADATPTAARPAAAQAILSRKPEPSAAPAKPKKAGDAERLAATADYIEANAVDINDDSALRTAMKANGFRRPSRGQAAALKDLLASRGYGKPVAAVQTGRVAFEKPNSGYVDHVPSGYQDPAAQEYADREMRREEEATENASPEAADNNTKAGLQLPWKRTTAFMADLETAIDAKACSCADLAELFPDYTTEAVSNLSRGLQKIAEDRGYGTVEELLFTHHTPSKTAEGSVGGPAPRAQSTPRTLILVGCVQEGAPGITLHRVLASSMETISERLGKPWFTADYGKGAGFVVAEWARGGCPLIEGGPILVPTQHPCAALFLDVCRSKGWDIIIASGAV